MTTYVRVCSYLRAKDATRERFEESFIVVFSWSLNSEIVVVVVAVVVIVVVGLIAPHSS